MIKLCFPFFIKNINQESTIPKEQIIERKNELIHTTDQQRHRIIAAQTLKGEGLEIGAFYHPFPIPKNCIISYLDLENVDVMRNLFPELSNKKFIIPDFIGDLNKKTVIEITQKKFDFIIFNHVLEHVANPIKIFLHIWDALKPGGYLIFSVPDKNYIFDKKRNITSNFHLLADYYLEVQDICSCHYFDILEHVHPEAYNSKETFIAALEKTKSRNEHPHVWDTNQIKSFLKMMFERFNINAHFFLESYGNENQNEYFSVLKKDNAPSVTEFLEVLTIIYNERDDLKKKYSENDSEIKNELRKWFFPLCWQGIQMHYY